MSKEHAQVGDLTVLKIEAIKKEQNGKIIAQMETGSNLKNRTIKRGYLNRDEFNTFMMLTSLNMLILGERSITNRRVPPMWESWVERGVMTPEQRKNLKMANTYFNKFINDVFNNNFDLVTKDKVIAQLVKYDFRLIDDHTVRQVYNLMDSATKEFHLTQDEFFDLVEAKMETSCKGCTKDRCECETRELFESKFIPPVNEGSQCNCEYAY